ncbi:MAG: hypothetical protein C5B49_02065 [Bdellovibrio sp.]|nr:MAG: hypothetical protein C5B49_02065 [Bdellovibrio sp.]
MIHRPWSRRLSYLVSVVGVGLAMIPPWAVAGQTPAGQTRADIITCRTVHDPRSNQLADQFNALESPAPLPEDIRALAEKINSKTPKVLRSLPREHYFDSEDSDAFERLIENAAARLSKPNLRILLEYMNDPEFIRNPFGTQQALKRWFAKRKGWFGPPRSIDLYESEDLNIPLNIELGLRILYYYDRFNRSNHALEVGLKLLGNLELNEADQDCGRYFDLVADIVQQSERPEAIRRFFSSVARSPAIDGFFRNRDMRHYLPDLLMKAVSQEESRHPDSTEMAFIFRGIIDRNNPASPTSPIVLAEPEGKTADEKARDRALFVLDVTKLALAYGRAIGDRRFEMFQGDADQIADQLKLPRSLIEAARAKKRREPSQLDLQTAQNILSSTPAVLRRIQLLKAATNGPQISAFAKKIKRVDFHQLQNYFSIEDVTQNPFQTQQDLVAMQPGLTSINPADFLTYENVLNGIDLLMALSQRHKIRDLLKPRLVVLLKKLQPNENAADYQPLLHKFTKFVADSRDPEYAATYLKILAGSPVIMGIIGDPEGGDDLLRLLEMVKPNPLSEMGRFVDSLLSAAIHYHESLADTSADTSRLTSLQAAHSFAGVGRETFKNTAKGLSGIYDAEYQRIAEKINHTGH